jgi:type VI protein secretion system component Hcp
VNARPDDEARPATTGGTSRRDLLRGGAIGVGAVVGAMGLINASEVAAEAAGGTGLALYAGFAGINLKQPMQVHSFQLGGAFAGATATASPATLVLESYKYSPKLLQAYAEKTSLAKVVIKGYRPNVQGLVTQFLTITLTGAQIVSYHAGAAVNDSLRDTVRVTFTGLTVLRNDANTTYTWTVPPL